MPVCCPQFGNMGPFQAQHGFVRNSQFSVKTASPTSATLQLVPTDDQLQSQIGAFTVQVHVRACMCTLQWKLDKCRAQAEVVRACTCPVLPTSA